MTGLSLEYIRRATITAAQQMNPIAHYQRDRRAQLLQAEDIACYPHRAKAQQRYDEPDGAPVIAANWNGSIMERAAQLFEDAGAVILWSDEVTSCKECYGAIDTSPHSYSHRPEYVIINECQPVCLDCLLYDDPDRPEAGYSSLLATFLEEMEDDPHRAVPYHISEEMLEELGYRKLPNPETASYTGDYESGFHPGQNDDPTKVAIRLHAAGYDRLLFRISSHGQFDTRWQVWHHAGDDETSDR